MDELGYDAEERDVLAAELEGVAHGFLDDAGAVSILRLHALAGRSLELAEDAGGRYTFGSKTRGLIDAMAAQAPFAQWLSTPVDSLGPVSDGVEVRTRNGDVLRARTCVLTVPLNVLPHVRFDDLSAAKRDAIALGQASRGIKLWLRVKGESRGINAIAPGSPIRLPDGRPAAARRHAAAGRVRHRRRRVDLEDRPALQRSLDELHPGLEIVDTTAHDWLADEFSLGTWAIHRPGWYTRHHAAMREPERRTRVRRLRFRRRLERLCRRRHRVRPARGTPGAGAAEAAS